MKYLIASLLIILSSFDLYSQGSTIDISQTFKKYMTGFPDSTQVAVGIINGTNETFYGAEKIGESVELIDNHNAVFEIGSISKVFTSALLAYAAESGVVSLDDNIQEFVDYPIKDSIEITLKELSNHTSGLPRLPGNLLLLMALSPDNPYVQYGDDLLEEYLQKHSSVEGRGTYQYSNLGAGLLAHCLSNHYQKSYATLLDEMIFDKLEMDASTIQMKNIPSLVKGRKIDGSVAPNWDFNSLAGAGAIKSTVSDMLKFSKAIIQKKDSALQLQLKPTFTISDKMDIGLGWHIIHKQDKSGSLYFHNGGTGGYTSGILLDLDSQKAIIILSNVSAYNPDSKNIEQIMFEIFQQIN